MNHKLKKIKYYVNTVLPSAYDDSLTYYELLSKVVNTINELIENQSENDKIISDFTSIVDTKLKNIADKIINDMYKRGEFQPIVDKLLLRTDEIKKNLNNDIVKLDNKIENVRSGLTKKIDNYVKDITDNISLGESRIYENLEDLKLKLKNGSRKIAITKEGKWYYWTGVWNLGGNLTVDTADFAKLDGVDRDIKTNEDLNNITKSGFYRISYDQTPQNIPTTLQITKKLIVMNPSPSATTQQIFFVDVETNEVMLFFRTVRPKITNWSLVTRSGLTYYFNVDDMNDIKQPKTIAINSSKSKNVKNIPHKNSGRLDVEYLGFADTVQQTFTTNIDGKAVSFKRLYYKTPDKWTEWTMNSGEVIISLSLGDDLNNYEKDCVIKCNSSNISKSLLNNPSVYSFKMIVESLRGSSVRQLLISSYFGQIYERFKFDDKWTEWVIKNKKLPFNKKGIKQYVGVSVDIKETKHILLKAEDYINTQDKYNWAGDEDHIWNGESNCSVFVGDIFGMYGFKKLYPDELTTESDIYDKFRFNRKFPVSRHQYLMYEPVYGRYNMRQLDLFYHSENEFKQSDIVHVGIYVGMDFTIENSGQILQKNFGEYIESDGVTCNRRLYNKERKINFFNRPIQKIEEINTYNFLSYYDNAIIEFYGNIIENTKGMKKSPSNIYDIDSISQGIVINDELYSLGINLFNVGNIRDRIVYDFNKRKHIYIKSVHKFKLGVTSNGGIVKINIPSDIKANFSKPMYFYSNAFETSHHLDKDGKQNIIFVENEELFIKHDNPINAEDDIYIIVPIEEQVTEFDLNTIKIKPSYGDKEKNNVIKTNGTVILNIIHAENKISSAVLSMTQNK